MSALLRHDGFQKHAGVATVAKVAAGTGRYSVAHQVHRGFCGGVLAQYAGAIFSHLIRGVRRDLCVRRVIEGECAL